MKLIQMILMSSLILLSGCAEDKKHVEGKDFIEAITAINSHYKKEIRKTNLRVNKLCKA